MILVFKFPPLEGVSSSDCRHLYLGARGRTSFPGGEKVSRMIGLLVWDNTDIVGYSSVLPVGIHDSSRFVFRA